MAPKGKNAYIATGIMGAVAFDGSGEVIDKVLFPKDAKLIAEKLRASREGTLLGEEQELISRLNEKGYVSTKAADSIAEKKMREEFRALAMQVKWASSQAEINSMLSAVGAASVAPKLKEQKSDRILMNAIGVADELDRVINVLMERLREWYGLHFPEAARSVESHVEFARIAGQGFRQDVTDEKAAGMAANSSGMEFSDEDMEQVRALANEIIGLFGLRDGMDSYIESSATKFFPNTAAIAGPALALRLLVLAGGIDKLAKMPSSTIQMLGAEKALFRHLKGQGSSPKHGILFSHELVQKAPHELKGKVARLVAAKLALAARVDFFSKDDRGAKMRAELDDEVKRAGSVI